MTEDTIKQKDDALRQLEELLRESNERLLFMAEFMPQKIFTAKPNGDMDYFNGRWMEFTGLSFEQIREIGLMQILHPEDFDETVRRWQHSISTGEPFSMEHRFRRADGVYCWHLSRAHARIDPHGNMLIWFGSNTEIDDIKRAEEAIRISRDALEAANKAKDRFLSVLSHELRTPLMPVLMTVQFLQNEPGMPQSVIEGLEVICRNIELEARLIDDLLDLTRISKGRLHLNIDVVDLHDVIRSAMGICSIGIVAKKLTTTIDLAAARHMVRGDLARLQQVMWNLFKNAIKFTNEGGHITVHSFNNMNGEIKVQVMDNGIGIDSVVLSHIFDAFGQGNRSISREFGGLGLGLAIAKSLVDLHEGKLEACSAGIGKGATFTLELRTIPSDAPTSADEDATPQPLAAKRELCILLVDDHQDTSCVMARLLQCMGYEVQTADSVSSALQAARQRPFDLLISDIGLPDGSGLELMQRLLELYPIKGIALSGFGMEEDVKKSKEAGFYEHLIKPINLKRLETVIRDLTASDTIESAG